MAHKVKFIFIREVCEFDTHQECVDFIAEMRAKNRYRFVPLTDDGRPHHYPFHTADYIKEYHGKWLLCYDRHFSKKHDTGFTDESTRFFPFNYN